MGQRFFSKLDLRSGYYQVGMKEDAIERTAFVTPAGVFEWVAMMPRMMGLCNAPSTFQRMMVEVLGSLVNKCVVVYLDDCLVFSTTLEEHLVHLRLVLQAFRKNTLFCNRGGEVFFCRDGGDILWACRFVQRSQCAWKTTR